MSKATKEILHIVFGVLFISGAIAGWKMLDINPVLALIAAFIGLLLIADGIGVNVGE
jgi:uncharacterized membrane protein